MKKRIDSDLLDRAIVFATKAHKGVERRGKGFPYICHPLDALVTASKMTNDQEILAAAVLHDVVEDTDTSLEEIRKEFGDRVASIVEGESSLVFAGEDETTSWKRRKQATIDRLANAPLDNKIAALADKFVNIKDIYHDFMKQGDKFWDLFHNNDPREHEWYYKGLVEALRDLEDFDVFKEFEFIVYETFRNIKRPFVFKVDGKNVFVEGRMNKENCVALFSELQKGIIYNFNFANVSEVNFAGIRALLKFYKEGYFFHIYNVQPMVMSFIEPTGICNFLSITKAPDKLFDMSKAEQAGSGFTALSYNINDGDSLLKLHLGMHDLSYVDKEKRYAQEVFKLGIPTPMCGEEVQVHDKYGVIYERIVDKRSIAKLLSEEPERCEEMAKLFANMCKKLHSTPCNPSVFESVNDRFNEIIEKSPLNDEEKIKLMGYINSIPKTNTCLHGDCHMGNVIITKDGEPLFIDLGDFSYGNPIFDLAISYFLSYFFDDAFVLDMFHIHIDLMQQFYRFFLKYYFDEKDPQKLQEKFDYIKNNQVLAALYFTNAAGWRHDLLSVVKEFLATL